jgi:hypothetical protein
MFILDFANKVLWSSQGTCKPHICEVLARIMWTIVTGHNHLCNEMHGVSHSAECKTVVVRTAKKITTTSTYV